MPAATDAQPANWFEELFTPITYYDGQFYTSPTQANLTPSVPTPTNGGVEPDAIQNALDSAKAGISSLSSGITDIQTITKILFVGAMVFGALLIVHEARIAVKG